MVQNQEQPVGKITFSILIALSLSHCLNDLLQSVLSASYPLFKDDLGLSFSQIGLITLVVADYPFGKIGRAWCWG